MIGMAVKLLTIYWQTSNNATVNVLQFNLTEKLTFSNPNLFASEGDGCGGVEGVWDEPAWVFDGRSTGAPNEIHFDFAMVYWLSRACRMPGRVLAYGG